MFDFIVKKIKYLNQLSRQKKEGEQGQEEKKLTTNLNQNIKELNSLFGDTYDLKIHEMVFGANKEHRCALVYIDGMTDVEIISNSIMKTITTWHYDENEKLKGKKLAEKLKTEIISLVDITEVSTYDEVAKNVLNGNTIMILDGSQTGLSLGTTGWEKRSIAEPQAETVLRGPREGFTENIKTNITLIRRKVKSEKLRVDSMTLGKKSNTQVCLMFLEGVANPDVVQTIKNRIKKINIDAVLDSGYIEQFIEDAPFSPFPTVANTEKPDVAAAKILEGRVAILVDGTPFVLTAPMLFIESFQTTEDYYLRLLQVNFNKIIRFFGYLISIFLPGIYIALTSFHQELIPTTLLLTISSAREGTPFPVFVEALIMVFAFEVLREAGIRLPRPVGQAISIVGALIMGEAAVSAGLVGSPIVITIAFTAVCSFLVPSQIESSTILRLIIMILATTLGFYGVLIGGLAIMVHLSNLTSFGVPYFDVFSYSSDLKDSVVRAPLWLMQKRPKDIAKGDTTRLEMNVPPLMKNQQDFEKEGTMEGGGQWKS